MKIIAQAKRYWIISVHVFSALSIAGILIIAGSAGAGYFNPLPHQPTRIQQIATLSGAVSDWQLVPPAQAAEKPLPMPGRNPRKNP